jgi:TRAP-type uncharacterized transport system substrate-binding protein
MKKTLIALAALASVSVFAQDAFVVATGDSKKGSTYSAMFRELNKVCSASINMVEKETTGSPENIDLLTSNTVNAAIAQGDLISYIDQTDPAKVANVKTVFALAPEELHFIARSDVKTEGGINVPGLGNFKGTKVEFKTLDDIAGRKVGGVGGSILSGRVVAKQSGLNFQMVDAGNNENLQKMLLEGQFDAILVVGGAPHGLVKTLDARFRLLPISQETAAKLKAYTPAKLSYANMNQAGVPTVQTQALFVSRTYRSPAMLASLAKLRSCFEQQVPNLQDARGTHPKWQVVDPSNHGRWTWYELPAAK